MKIHEYNEMMAYLTRPGRVKLVKGSPDPMMLLEEKLRAAYKEKLLKNFDEGKITESFREFVQTQKEIDINPGKKKLDKAIEEAKKILKDKKTKFKANMVPGLETLIKTVEAMPDDFRARRYWTLGLKSLGIVATPLIAYDGYTAIKEGLPVDEVVAKALLGADKLLYKGKEVLQLTPEEREARSVVKQNKLKELNENQMMGFGFIEGPEVDSDLSLDEAKAKLKNCKDRYSDFRKKRDAVRAKQRKDTFTAITDPQEILSRKITAAEGGRVGFKKMIKKLTTTVPPKKGPNPQGLNIPSKQVTTIKSEKTNGRNRQVFTKRKANVKYS